MTNIQLPEVTSMTKCTVLFVKTAKL